MQAVSAAIWVHIQILFRAKCQTQVSLVLHFCSMADAMMSRVPRRCAVMDEHLRSRTSDTRAVTPEKLVLEDVV